MLLQYTNGYFSFKSYVKIQLVFVSYTDQLTTFRSEANVHKQVGP